MPAKPPFNVLIGSEITRKEAGRAEASLELAPQPHVVAPAERAVLRVGVEHHPAVGAAGHLEGDPRRQVRLDQARDHVHGRLLRGQHQVDPHGPALLGETRDEVLDVLGARHPLLDQPSRLVHRQRLDARHDEAGRGLADDRHLARRLQQRGHRLALVGAEPVLVDCDEDTFLIDTAAVEAAITPRTRALMPVHLYGQCADYAPIGEICERYGATLIEDAAEALKLTAQDLQHHRIIDGIIEEPLGGAHRDAEATVNKGGEQVEAALSEMSGMDGGVLRAKRKAKFLDMHQPVPA